MSWTMPIENVSSGISGGAGGCGGGREGGVTSYIWHSTDVRAEWYMVYD